MDINGNGKFPSRWVGNVRPDIPQRKAIPLFDKKLPIVSGDKSGTVIVRILPASFAYPKASLFFGFNYGTNRTFQTISLENLYEIRDFLSKCLEEINPVLDASKQQEEIIDRQQKALFESGEMQRIMSMIQSYHEEPEEVES